MKTMEKIGAIKTKSPAFNGASYALFILLAITACLSDRPLCAASNTLSSGDLYSSIVIPAYQHQQKHYDRMENSIRGLLVYE